MKVLTWLLVIALVACFGYWLRRSMRRLAEQRSAAEERAARLLAQAMGAKAAPGAPNGAAPKPATPGVHEQLLLDAGMKAAAAGEPALSIQLYARLLARFPQSTLASQARAAVDEQKKKLSTATVPGPAGPG